MSRKYFGTDGVRGRVGQSPITPDFVMRLGYSAGKALLEQSNMPPGERPAVLIGKDTRLSGYMLESALEAGLSAAGIDVFLVGPLPTPQVLNVDHGRQRFVLFKLDPLMPTTGTCTTPAMAWIDSPASGATVDRSFDIVVAWKRQETFRSLFFCICVCMVERSLNGRCSLALILLPFCGTGFPCSGCNFQVVRALLYFDLGSAIGNNAIVQGELSKIDQLPHDLVECRLAHPAIGRQPPDMVFDGAAFLVDPAKDHGVDAHVLRA